MKSASSAGSVVSLVAVVLCTAAVTVVMAQPPSKETPGQLKEYRIDRVVSEHARECIDCHTEVSSGIVADWASSRHAHANITCLDCHGSGPWEYIVLFFRIAFGDS